MRWRRRATCTTACRCSNPGVELYEIRARPESRRGTGQSGRTRAHGHLQPAREAAGVRSQWTFIGSMNYDQRSRRLNTEDGLIIHSAELAAQTRAASTP